MNEIVDYIRAGYPGVFIETNEIKRCTESIFKSIKNNESLNDVLPLSWDIIRGIPQMGDEGRMFQGDPISVLNSFIDINTESFKTNDVVLIMENLDNFFGLNVAQTILNNIPMYKEKGITIIGVGSDSKTIPKIIKEYFPVLNFKLPDKIEIKFLVNKCIENAKAQEQETGKEEYTFDDVNDNMINTFLGMTYEEIENSIARSLIIHKTIDLNTIIEAKKQAIESSGFMKFYNSIPINQVGGLKEYKDYWNKRKEPFFNSNSTKPKVRSVFLTGVPGTGKSLVMKATASILEWPLIILDVGSLKGSLVGETEKNTRMATRIIDGIGNVIIGIEEIEKLFGSTGKGTSHETSEGMLNYFLTWMQERTSNAIIIATCNNIELLPAELTRAGRWDTVFFADLPNTTEIKEIITIKNHQFKSNIPTDELFIEKLYEQKWSGAEIEQLAKDLHYDELESAIKMIPILAQNRKDQMEKLYEQAKMFRKANRSESSKFVDTFKSANRKLKLRSKQ